MVMGSKCLRMLHVMSLIISVTVILLPCQVVCTDQCDFQAIFNFGDSNSDTGGFSAMFGQAPPPNGETFFHTPAGRYCDGRLLIDFIAEGLGLPHLSAYLDSMDTNFGHGANFATAGSTIRRQNTTIFQSGYSPISLDVQAVEFSDFQKRSQIIHKQGDNVQQLFPTEDDFYNALYTFDIGQNDLTAAYTPNMSVEEVKSNVPNIISQFSNIIKKIYAQGGRTFWIHNTAPGGCLIYIMNEYLKNVSDEDKHGCFRPYNGVSEYFNQKLKKVVTQLRKELPLAAITYVDLYSVKYSLISQARNLGFGDPFLACCGHGGKHNYNDTSRCGSTEIVDGKKIVVAKSCKDPSSSISWDGIHFTEKANKWIYDQIINGSFSDPPVPLSLACHRREKSNYTN